MDYPSKTYFPQVYKDNVLVYDSLYPDKMDIWEEDVEVRYYDWETYYTVLFADGQAEVSISGVYAYRFHNYAVIAELILSFSSVPVYCYAGYSQDNKVYPAA